MTSKYTVGPYRVGDAGHTVFGPPNGRPSPQIIASVSRPDDARFIVRACNAHDELLAALRQIVDSWNDARNLGRTPCLEDRDYGDLARAAIAKAVQS